MLKCIEKEILEYGVREGIDIMWNVKDKMIPLDSQMGAIWLFRWYSELQMAMHKISYN